MQKHQPCSQATFSLSDDAIFLMVSSLLGRFLVSFNLQSAICGLQSAVCGLRSAVCGLRSAVCGLRSAVCGLQSPVCSLQMSYTAKFLTAKYLDTFFLLV